MFTANLGSFLYTICLIEAETLSFNIAHKYKEKLLILQSIGIVVIKSKETRVIIYTCRYSNGSLIPNSSWHNWIIGIKCPLEYLLV